MKKTIRISLALCLLLLTSLLCACGAPAAAPEASPSIISGAFSEADLGVALEGKPYYLREDSAAVLQILGDGYEYSEMVSCVYDGKDKTYAYPGLTVSTVPVEGKDVVEMFTLTDPTYDTLRGIRVGDGRETVIAAYGEDFFDDGYLNYTLTNDPEDVQAERIQFEMVNDAVVRIYIYSPSY